MKSSILSALLLCFVLVGCSTHDLAYDDVKRAPTKSVEVFREGMKPSKPYKEISELTYVGFVDEEPGAKQDLIKRAKKIGANGLIFLPREDTGYQFNLGAKSGHGANFKAIAFVYE